MLPEGWNKRSVAEVCRSVSVGVVVKPSQYYVSAREGVKAFRSANIKEGQINNSDWVYFSHKGHNENKKSELKSGDVLVVRTGYPGTSCVVSPEYAGCNAIDIVIARPDIQKIIPTYLCLFTNSEYGKSQVANLQGGMAQKHLNVGAYQQVEIPLPPLPEQKKIAAILSTWDRAIEGTEKLLANSQQQKKALMQQLLTGKKRLPGFTGEWKLSPISAFIKESRIPGSSGDVARKITIKLYGGGVFPKEEKREGSESTKYYKRKSGQFIYSKLDFLNGAFGIIPTTLDGYESTLDLPAFDFLHNVSSQWFIFYVSREEFYSANLGLANGGRKARRVNPSDLLRISVPTPLLPEQKAIAAVLSTADEEITALESDLARLRQEKKALMQQLLTGKRRVTVD